MNNEETWAEKYMREHKMPEPLREKLVQVYGENFVIASRTNNIAYLKNGQVRVEPFAKRNPLNRKETWRILGAPWAMRAEAEKRKSLLPRPIVTATGAPVPAGGVHVYGAYRQPKEITQRIPTTHYFVTSPGLEAGRERAKFKGPGFRLMGQGPEKRLKEIEKLYKQLVSKLGGE